MTCYVRYDSRPHSATTFRTTLLIAGPASAWTASGRPASPARVSSESMGTAPRYGTPHAAAIASGPFDPEQNTCAAHSMRHL